MRWVKSLRTTSNASFLDAEVNNDPAYLPAAVSAMAGGLWPEINKEIPGTDLTPYTAKKNLGMYENFLSIILDYLWLNINQLSK